MRTKTIHINKLAAPQHKFGSAYLTDLFL